MNARQLTIDFGDQALETTETPPNVAKGAPNATKGDGGDSRLYFMSMGSGSSGNACYIGNASVGFVIDAGVKPEVIEAALRNVGIPMSRVKGVLLTHDHSDHVRHAYGLLRKNKHIRLFCTMRALNGILRRHNISKRIKEYHYPIFKETPFSIGEMRITAFEVPHDGTDNAGFFIEYGGSRFVVATDLGEVAGRARHYIEQANYLVIEANYDARMLRDGPYPEYLKARIATSHGHMDNADTARLISEIASPELRYIFLCHLSEDNNTPEKALEAVGGALNERGFTVGDCSNSIEDRAADVSLMALPRFDASRLFVFRKPIP